MKVLSLFFLVFASLSALAAPDVQLAVTDDGFCVLVVSRSEVRCFNGRGAVVPLAFTPSRPTLIKGAGHDACMVDANGVHCWTTGGDKDHAYYLEKKARGYKRVVDLTVAPTQLGGLCFIDEDYGTVCPLDSDHELADVPQGVRFTQIAARQSDSARGWACGIRDNGLLQCWGGWPKIFEGSLNVLRDEILDIPPDLGPVKAIAVGDFMRCALVSNAVRCWTRRWEGVTQPYTEGDIESLARAMEASRLIYADDIAFTGFSSSTQLASGNFHVCALDEGKLRCWAESNPLDDDIGPAVAVAGHYPWRKAPIRERIPPILKNPVVAIGASGDRTCALDTEGSVGCWVTNQMPILKVDGNVPPLKLEKAEEWITNVSRVVKASRAPFFTAAAKLAREVATTPVEKLFVLNALGPALEEIRSEQFEKHIYPAYQSDMSAFNQTYKKTRLADFLSEPHQKQLTLGLLAAAVSSVIPQVAEGGKVEAWRQLLASLGTALASRGASPADIRKVNDALRALTPQLAEMRVSQELRGMANVIWSLSDLLRE